MIGGIKWWCRAPSESVLQALPSLRWSRTGERSAASDTAALMVYIALVLMSDFESEEFAMSAVPSMGILEVTSRRTVQIARATYDELHEATGLSRTLIAAGVGRLAELELVQLLGSHQKRRYLIVAKGNSAGWFKVPCMPIVRNRAIVPFATFTLRSKHELHALKLYLYLAARRTNSLEYTAVTYENIFERIGLPERDIRRATSLLLNSGLLRNVHRENDVARRVYGPNQYYLTGSDRLRGLDSGPATAPLAGDL